MNFFEYYANYIGSSKKRVTEIHATSAFDRESTAKVVYEGFEFAKITDKIVKAEEAVFSSVEVNGVHASYNSPFRLAQEFIHEDDFMTQIINSTDDYSFVRYKIEANGTLYTVILSVERKGEKTFPETGFYINVQLLDSILSSWEVCYTYMKQVGNN